MEMQACPYCNAMLVITVKKDKARFQLNHFYPQSKYSMLATSFFNLIPCCANCNIAKSDKIFSPGKNFHLYDDETPEDAFKFSLDPANFSIHPPLALTRIYRIIVLLPTPRDPSISIPPLELTSPQGAKKPGLHRRHIERK